LSRTTISGQDGVQIKRGGEFDAEGATTTVNAYVLNSGDLIVDSDFTADGLTNAVNGGSYVAVNGTLSLNNEITSIGTDEDWAIRGTVNSGATEVGASTFEGLNSIKGSFYLENEQVNRVTPSTGTLVVQTDQLIVFPGTTLQVNGNVSLNQTDAEIDAGASYGGQATVNVFGTLSLALNTSVYVTGANQNTYFPLGSTLTADKIVNAGLIDAELFGGGGLVKNGTGVVPTGTTGYYQTANGSLEEHIGGANAFGLIDVDGPAYLNGTLDPVLDGGFNPTLGQTFQFLTFDGTYEGPGFNLEDAQIGNGLQGDLVYGNDFAELEVGPLVPEPTTLPLLLASGLVLILVRKSRALRPSLTNWVRQWLG
jgi:hypothetical protein